MRKKRYQYVLKQVEKIFKILQAIKSTQQSLNSGSMLLDYSC